MSVDSLGVVQQNNTMFRVAFVHGYVCSKLSGNALNAICAGDKGNYSYAAAAL